MPSSHLSSANLAELITHLSGVFYQSCWQKNGSHKIINISSNCTEILGLKPQELLENHTLLWAFIHPEDQAGFQQSFTQAAHQLKPWKWEWRQLTPTGKIKWLSGVATPAPQSNGGVIWNGLILDISKYRESTLVIRQQLSRERLVTGIQERIRKTLNLEDILQTAVAEVRSFLNTDRTVIYQFNPDWSGQGIVESVGENWMPILGISLLDPCFKKKLYFCLSARSNSLD